MLSISITEWSNTGVTWRPPGSVTNGAMLGSILTAPALSLAEKAIISSLIFLLSAANSGLAWSAAAWAECNSCNSLDVIEGRPTPEAGVANLATMGAILGSALTVAALSLASSDFSSALICLDSASKSGLALNAVCRAALIRWNVADEGSENGGV